MKLQLLALPSAKPPNADILGKQTLNFFGREVGSRQQINIKEAKTEEKGWPETT